MGKRRWKRKRLVADLADKETQARLLRGIDAAQEGNQAPERGDRGEGKGKVRVNFSPSKIS